MSSQVGGSKRHNGEDNNFQMGFMKMLENLMNAEVVEWTTGILLSFEGMPCIGHVQHALGGAEHQWQRE